jgi:tetrahydromethanopterin S-methyltransferase subunit A
MIIAGGELLYCLMRHEVLPAIVRGVPHARGGKIVTAEQEPKDETKISLIHSVMRLMKRLMPSDEPGENAAAVRMFHRVDTVLGLVKTGPLRLLRPLGKGPVWPAISGAYIVKDPNAPVAVCTLTSNELIHPVSELPGIAIVGRVYTPNLGLEKIILNVTANPAIRLLLLCGRESSIFQPGQAFQALFSNGITADQRIIGATGYFPVLQNVTSGRIAVFRRQVELVDYTGETDMVVLEAQISTLVAWSPGPFTEQWEDNPIVPYDNLSSIGQDEEQFTSVRPGGRREPLAYDPKGFFVITLDRSAREIVVRHYLPDHIPGYMMRGRSAERILLGLLRAELVSQLSHAGYLGAELAKAEAALRLNLVYEQDQPLRTR